ncbi:cytochrome-c peroxidase [Vibrio coralliirubri]|uniref:cytochrome-c peroxidase n=1 Tax=Vibrio coralliirubri TaxID=1516159 RepID=UPI00073E82BF|nr:cytochrome c peroxidase [Vibrio coralliirubri]
MVSSIAVLTINSKISLCCLFIISSIFILIAGCSDNESKNNKDIQLGSLIEKNELSLIPLINLSVPDIDSPIAQLGKALFYSKSLGGEEDSACVTCHHPLLGGGDDLSLSVGVGAELPDLLGVGRTTTDRSAPTVPRNALTVFNIALWEQTLFWDGRVEVVHNVGLKQINTPDGQPDLNAGDELLFAQAAFPVTSSEEMRGHFKQMATNDELRKHLAKRLADVPDYGDPQLAFSHWPDMFRTAFNQPSASASEVITPVNIQLALSAFQRTMLFVDNPWFAYLKGDISALTTQQKHGAILFYAEKQNGGAHCANCHSGLLFSDEKLHPLGFPQIGHGKGDGVADSDGNTDDFGRYRVTNDFEDIYKFRTPTLLNVAHTAPYGHAGSFNTLKEVITYSANPSLSSSTYFLEHQWCQSSQLSRLEDCMELYPLAKERTQQSLSARQAFEQKHPISVTLTDNEIEDIEAFLHALTDPCILNKECMKPWLYDSSVINDPDENVLRAVSESGELL